MIWFDFDSYQLLGDDKSETDLAEIVKHSKSKDISDMFVFKI